MAVGSERGSSNRTRSRGRASGNSSGAASGSSRARASSRQSASRQSSGGSGQQEAQARQRSTGARARSASATERATASDGGAQGDHSARETIANIGIPVVSATIGVAGGVLLGRSALQRNRKFLGIPLPMKIDLADVSQQIGEAARQFGKLAQEVKTAREKAEQIGRAIT